MSPRSPEEVMASIADAVNAHDLDAFVALHEPDAVVIVPPDGVRACGHDEIRKVLAGEQRRHADADQPFRSRTA